MHRIATVAAVLALAGCASAPLVAVPNETRTQTMPVAQAEAECRFEATKAIAGEQNLGVRNYYFEKTYVACLDAKGYRIRQVSEVTP